MGMIMVCYIQGDYAETDWGCPKGGGCSKGEGGHYLEGTRYHINLVLTSGDREDAQDILVLTLVYIRLTVLKLICYIKLIS